MEQPLWCTDVDEIYHACFEKWGVQSQLSMLIEECGELIVALCHMQRKNKDGSIMALAEEIADVEIMLDEIKWFYHDELRGTIDRVKREKINRLVEIIKEE